ncbi:unnamed protein product [Anisakis simplex]|uniref:INCENP_ARK-bind domain-containing protein n=1 Tax=Anisakis simplex TaxID=6269 RepID=A0A158PNK2_ANISI|nr:unnamed protein product [Anisakis simplex]
MCTGRFEAFTGVMQRASCWPKRYSFQERQRRCETGDKKLMGDTSHGMMSRSINAGSQRKNNSEEVAKRRAALQEQLEQRREQSRRQQEERMAKAAAQKEERLARHREIQQREMLRAKAVLDRRAQVLAEAEEKKAAVLAKAHAESSRLAQQKTRPVFAFGSSTPRELGYLTQLTKEQKVYNRKLQPDATAVLPASSQSSSPFGRLPTGRIYNNRSPMTKSLYGTLVNEAKTRCKPLPANMTQSMVSPKAAPPQRQLLNKSLNKAQKRVSEGRNKATATLASTPPSSNITVNTANKYKSSNSQSKSPSSMTHPAKAVAIVHDKRIREESKEGTVNNTNIGIKASANVSAVADSVISPKVSPPNITNDSSVENKVAMNDDKQKAVIEALIVDAVKKEQQQVNENVEVVHDSPSNENVHVNTVQRGAVIKDMDENVMDESRILQMTNDTYTEPEQVQMISESLVVEVNGSGGEKDEQEERKITWKVGMGGDNDIDDGNSDNNNNNTNNNNNEDGNALLVSSGSCPSVGVEKQSLDEQNANEVLATGNDGERAMHTDGHSSPSFELRRDKENKHDKMMMNNHSEASGSSTVDKLQHFSSSLSNVDHDDNQQHLSSATRLDQLQLRTEQEAREREQRKARLAAIMKRTRGTPTAIVAPTQNIITDEGSLHEPLKDVEHTSTVNVNDNATPHVLSHTAASVLQKLASSNPRLLSVLQRNGSNPSLADELTTADPSMTLPGQPDEPSSPHEANSTAPLRPIDFHSDVSQSSLAFSRLLGNYLPPALP